MSVQVPLLALIRLVIPVPGPGAPLAMLEITPMELPTLVPSSCSVRFCAVLLVFPAEPIVTAALAMMVTGLSLFPADILKAVKETPAVPLVTLLPELIVIAAEPMSKTPKLWVMPAPVVSRFAMMVLAAAALLPILMV